MDDELLPPCKTSCQRKGLDKINEQRHGYYGVIKGEFGYIRK